MGCTRFDAQLEYRIYRNINVCTVSVLHMCTAHVMCICDQGNVCLARVSMHTNYIHGRCVYMGSDWLWATEPEHVVIPLLPPFLDVNTYAISDSRVIGVHLVVLWLMCSRWNWVV